MNFTIYSIFK